MKEKNIRIAITWHQSKGFRKETDMKIIMDTINRTVTKKPSKKDKKLSEIQQETIVANLILTCMLGNAIRNFKGTEARKKYVWMICREALRILDGRPRDEDEDDCRQDDRK